MASFWTHEKEALEIKEESHENKDLNNVDKLKYKENVQ